MSCVACCPTPKRIPQHSLRYEPSLATSRSLEGYKKAVPLMALSFCIDILYCKDATRTSLRIDTFPVAGMAGAPGQRARVLAISPLIFLGALPRYHSPLSSSARLVDCKYLPVELYKLARNLMSRQATSATSFALRLSPILLCVQFRDFRLVSICIISAAQAESSSLLPSPPFSLSPSFRDRAHASDIRPSPQTHNSVDYPAVVQWV